MEEDREPQTKFPAPPLFTEKYVKCTTYLYIYIYITNNMNALNVNKVNSK